ncbi:hypothetical protein N7501_000109 [Penicillium viridicatum]|nr:hypothetical protein N7501_000109 [Penicillium viridicatum]
MSLSIIRNTQFATGTNLTSTEQAPLQTLVTLCRDHIILVNDLFSFDKEKKDMESRGSTFINTVNYLRLTLSLETRTAKIVAQSLIAELELQIHQEQERLQSDQTLSDRQIRYSLGVVESFSHQEVS